MAVLTERQFPYVKNQRSQKSNYSLNYFVAIFR
jgi:hypothetical protein